MDAEHPRAVADGHADSHDEYGIALCRGIGKLLIMQGEIVVTDKVASAGGARVWGKRSGFEARRADATAR